MFLIVHRLVILCQSFHMIFLIITVERNLGNFYFFFVWKLFQSTRLYIKGILNGPLATLCLVNSGDVSVFMEYMDSIFFDYVWDTSDIDILCNLDCPLEAGSIAWYYIPSYSFCFRNIKVYFELFVYYYYLFNLFSAWMPFIAFH